MSFGIRQVADEQVDLVMGDAQVEQHFRRLVNAREHDWFRRVADLPEVRNPRPAGLVLAQDYGWCPLLGGRGDGRLSDGWRGNRRRSWRNRCWSRR